MLACAKLRRSVIACAGIDTRTMTARNCRAVTACNRAVLVVGPGMPAPTTGVSDCF